MKQIEDIFLREAQRLDDLSKQNLLDKDGIARLVALTHALKNYAGSPIEAKGTALDHLSLEELQELAKEQQDEQPETEPGIGSGEASTP